MDTQGFEIGDVVEESDGYEGRIARFIEPDLAELDYSEFPSDVPPEGTIWELSELIKVG